MSDASTRDVVVRLFEQARENPGAAFEPDRFLAFLGATPVNGTRPPDTFRGRRRFVRFMESVEISTGICFTHEEWNRGFTLDQYVAIVEKKAAHPEHARRLAVKRARDASRRTIDEPIKFGIIAAAALAVPFAAGGTIGRALSLAVWVAVIAVAVLVNIKQRRHYDAIARRTAGVADG